MFEKIIRFAIEQRWFVLLATLAMAAPATAQERAPTVPPRTISVSGEGQAAAAPEGCNSGRPGSDRPWSWDPWGSAARA